MRTAPLSCACALLLCACPVAERYEAADLGDAVQLVCPGDPSGLCDFDDDASIEVGFAAVEITPLAWETWTDVDGNGEYGSGVDSFEDCGVDRLCEGDPGWTAADEGEGDGVFQGLWLAGFGNARAMSEVADPIWARATWLEQGNTTLGVVSVDLIGLFYDDVLEIRRSARDALGLDHVVLSSTHVHEAPDTLGQWGRNMATSGVDPAFMEQIHEGVAQALREARDGAVAASVFAGSYSIPGSAWNGTGVNNVNLDTRDPNITDETVWTVRFEDASGGTTLGTWINFGNHPEASGSSNTKLTSDFAHTLRETVEQGAEEGPDGALAGAGGVAVYLQGACGGMQTPLHATTIDLDGTTWSDDGVGKAYAVGRVTGYHALQAIGAEALVEEPRVSFRSRDLYVPVENQLFHLAMNMDLFDRQAFHHDDGALFSEDNVPDLLTEVSLFEIGDVAAITVPGELLPELAIGGYDGSHTGPVWPIVQPDNPGPPDLAAAPAGPYIKDLMPGTSKLLLGLGNDEIGYIIPDYDFVLDEGSPWFDEAPGDHYEETNSVGPQAQGLVATAIEGLLAWTPPE